jgi:hypothetical protein
MHISKDQVLTLHLILCDLDPFEMSVEPSPSSSQWSGKEILDHLIDSAINNHRRFITSLSKEDLIFEGL